VGVLLAFSGPPFNLSGTLVLLLMTYIVIHMPEASIAANAAVAQVGKELLEASSTSGATEGRTFREILMPLTLPGMVSGWALLFVLMAGELTASALLAGARNPVIGFVILDIWEQGTFGTLAALAFSFTIITSSIVIIVTWLSRRRTHR
jgi:iron(III) transport system permease protein